MWSTQELELNLNWKQHMLSYCFFDVHAPSSVIYDCGVHNRDSVPLMNCFFEWLPQSSGVLLQYCAHAAEGLRPEYVKIWSPDVLSVSNGFYRECKYMNKVYLEYIRLL